MGDWIQLIRSLVDRPTNVHKIISGNVDYYGYYDVCNTGAGGVWFPLDSVLEPFVWRVNWPPDIIRKLQIYDGISISDVECAGVLLQQMALELTVSDLRHKKALSLCDNMPTVSWVTRLASKQSRIGGCLVSGLVFRACNREMCLPEALSIAGEANEMADVAPRSHNAKSGYLFNDHQLLTHFANNFPLPQNHSWKIVTLTQGHISKVVSTLRGETLTMAQWTGQYVSPTGTSGRSLP